MHHEPDNQAFLLFTDLFFGIPALLAIGLYIVAVLASNRQKRLEIGLGCVRYLLLQVCFWPPPQWLAHSPVNPMSISRYI